MAKLVLCHNKFSSLSNAQIFSQMHFLSFMNNYDIIVNSTHYTVTASVGISNSGGEQKIKFSFVYKTFRHDFSGIISVSKTSCLREDLHGAVMHAFLSHLYIFVGYFTQSPSCL